MNRHTLSVLVENKPGVLVRIAGLFSRRGFNIDSLAVGPTEHPEISRMTIVVNCDGPPAGAGDQAAQQADQRPQDRGARADRVGAARAAAGQGAGRPESRSRVLETVALFRAKVVDVAQDAVTVEATGNRDKLDALIRVLEPFGIKELVQSGMVALGRGGRSITDRALRTAGPCRGLTRPS